MILSLSGILLGFLGHWIVQWHGCISASLYFDGTRRENLTRIVCLFVYHFRSLFEASRLLRHLWMKFRSQDVGIIQRSSFGVLIPVLIFGKDVHHSVECALRSW